MSEAGVRFTVFTKPWRMPIAELSEHVAKLGFHGIELPVRPGYPVDPENVAKELPRAAKILSGRDLTIDSIAGPTDERTIAACAEAGVRVIRICVDIRPDETYPEGEARLRDEWQALVPVLEAHGVTLGIQNHCGRSVANAAQLRAVLAGFDPRYVGAVWDAAHNALEGEQADLALDIVWPHLCMVNLKNAYWKRTNGPEAEIAEWIWHWTSGRQGLASWPRVIQELKKRKYAGVVCLTAEYSEEHSVDRLIAEDIAFAKSLFE